MHPCTLRHQNFYHMGVLNGRNKAFKSFRNQKLSFLPSFVKNILISVFFFLLPVVPVIRIFATWVLTVQNGRNKTLNRLIIVRKGLLIEIPRISRIYLYNKSWSEKKKTFLYVPWMKMSISIHNFPGGKSSGFQWMNSCSHILIWNPEIYHRDAERRLATKRQLLGHFTWLSLGEKLTVIRGGYGKVW